MTQDLQTALWEANAVRLADKWARQMPEVMPENMEQLRLFEKQTFMAGYLFAKREETQLLKSIKQ